MSKKIKEIRKIESPIKEIKKVKINSLDDEFYEDSKTESSVDNLSVIKRSNKNPTLKADEILQDTVVRERTIPKEDVEEIRFRPSYTAGVTDNKPAYTPVGAAESSAIAARTKTFGEEGTLERRNTLQPQLDRDEQKRGEMSGAREYIEDNNQKKDRKRVM